MPDGLVSADEFLDALRSLGAKLHRKGVTADGGEVFPTRPISGRARLLIEDILDQQAAQPG